jgi:RecJ-like exonuclease
MHNSRFGSSGGGGGGGLYPQPELCSVCGGDGHIDNAWGQRAKCPSCHGSGRRRVDTGFHDVTKTKESHHHRPTNRAAVVEKQTWPTSVEGMALATQIKESAKLSEATKARLTREIIEHESTHGQPTKTFLKKVRKENGLLPPKPSPA